MSLSFDEKYEIIYMHEEDFAYALAKRVVKKPEVSAWMFLVPILFIHHAYKINQYKAGVKGFANGIMASKRKALDKVYREVSSGEKLSYETEDYFPDVELKTLHDKALAQKQEKVIRIMESHFNALLSIEGESMAELLRNAYGSAIQYRQYFDELAEVEKILNQYLIENVYANGEANEVVKEIEKNCKTLRDEEIQYFFG